MVRLLSEITAIERVTLPLSRDLILPTRAFGANGERLSIVAVGCGRVGSLGNQTPMREIRATLARALELGITVFDTADIYGQGDSERELGRLLLKRRRRAFVVTKLGRRATAHVRLLRPLKPLLRPLLRRSRSGRDALLVKRADAM